MLASEWKCPKCGSSDLMLRDYVLFPIEDSVVDFSCEYSEEDYVLECGECRYVIDSKDWYFVDADVRKKIIIEGEYNYAASDI